MNGTFGEFVAGDSPLKSVLEKFCEMKADDCRTFTHKDDLVERVLQEPRRDVRFYLDSGWPGDNYKVGLAMALALAHCGYRYGLDFMYFAFPNAKHSENDWEQRLHVPFQFFADRPAVVWRLKDLAAAGQE